MRVDTPKDLGTFLRERRRAENKTQAQVAAAAGVSLRWLTALESGKPGAEVALVLRVVHALRLRMSVEPVEYSPDELDLDEYLRRFGDDR